MRKGAELFLIVVAVFPFQFKKSFDDENTKLRNAKFGKWEGSKIGERFYFVFYSVFYFVFISFLFRFLTFLFRFYFVFFLRFYLLSPANSWHSQANIKVGIRRKIFLRYCPFYSGAPI